LALLEVLSSSKAYGDDGDNDIDKAHTKISMMRVENRVSQFQMDFAFIGRSSLAGYPNLPHQRLPSCPASVYDKDAWRTGL
jgi:hypothetical protein